MTHNPPAPLRAPSFTAADPDRTARPAPLAAQHLRLTTRIGPTAHDCVTFSFVVAGRYRKITPTGPITLRAGHVTIADAGMVRTYEPEEPSTLIKVFVSPGLHVADASWLADVPRLRELIATGPAGRPVVLDIGVNAMRTLVPYLDALAASSLSAPMSSVARFVEILEGITLADGARLASDTDDPPEAARLIPLHMAPSLRHQPAVFDAIMLMSDAIGQPWTAAGLAAAVRVSGSQLRRLFAFDVGMPPMAYLAELRDRRLAYLMRRSNASVAEAARACGFPDPSHAARRFRARWGMSPLDYRTAFSAEHTPPSALPHA
ncbi:MAG: helix-turn-helix transcriptional regulator [Microbacteriaceae bacterium]